MHMTCLNLHTLRCRQSAYVQYASFLRLAYENLFCVICTSYLSPVPKVLTARHRSRFCQARKPLIFIGKVLLPYSETQTAEVPSVF